MGGDDNSSLVPSLFIGYGDAKDIMNKYLYPKSKVRNKFLFD